MGYIGKRPADVPLAASDVPNLDTSKVTTGTFANARIGESSVTQHVTATDLTPVRQDVVSLALHSAVADNKAAYNLPNSFIDQFEDDTGISSETTGDRNTTGEYWSSITLVTEPNTLALWTFPDATTTVGDSTGETYVDDVGKLEVSELGNNGQEIITDGNFAGYRAFETGGWTYQATGYGIQVGTVSGQTNPLNFGTGAFTIEFWAKDESGTPPQSQCLFGMDKADGSGVIQPGAWSAGTTWVSNWVDGSVYATSGLYTSYHGTSWKHVAYVRDASGNHGFWVNGGIASGQGNGTAISPNSGSAYRDYSAAGTNSDALDFSSGSAKVYWGTRTSSQETGHTAFAMYRYSDIARYDATAASITVPTAAFSAQTGATNATGTVVGTANVPDTAKTKVSGVMNYKDEAGTASIGTDLKIYFTCDNSNWTEVPTYTAVTPVFSTGVKMVKLAETTCTSGSDVRYKAVFANQATAKNTRLYGIGINY